jgi:hypothetical protein
MSTALLDRLRKRGVILTVVDGKLRVKAPSGVLQPGDKETISTARDELLGALEVERMNEPSRRRPCTEATFLEGPLDRLDGVDAGREIRMLKRFYSTGHEESAPWSEDDLDLFKYLLRNINGSGFWSMHFGAADKYLERTLPQPLYQLLRDAYERAKHRRKIRNGAATEGQSQLSDKNGSTSPPSSWLSWPCPRDALGESPIGAETRNRRQEESDKTIEEAY